MTKQFYLFILFSLLIMACGDSETKNTPEKGIDLAGEEVIMKDLPVQEFTPMPDELSNMLKDNISTIELEIISDPGVKTISDQAEMTKILSYISPEVATMSRNCDIKAFVNLDLQDTSRYLLQVFPESSCGYVVIFEKTKALHANKLTEEGIQYFQAAMNQN